MGIGGEWVLQKSFPHTSNHHALLKFRKTQTWVSTYSCVGKTPHSITHTIRPNINCQHFRHRLLVSSNASPIRKLSGPVRPWPLTFHAKLEYHPHKQKYFHRIWNFYDLPVWTYRPECDRQADGQTDGRHLFVIGSPMGRAVWQVYPHYRVPTLYHQKHTAQKGLHH